MYFLPGVDGGERGHAQHRAPRHRGELSGVLDWPRAGVWGIATPTRGGLARLDRKRKKKALNSSALSGVMHENSATATVMPAVPAQATIRS